MNTVLMQASLDKDDIESFKEEFPQYYFQQFESDVGSSKINWENIEILYGSRLSAEELARSPNLRWIHSPTPSLSRLCLNEIANRGNILVTTIGEENVKEVGEFVIGTLLSFAKHLFHWHESMQQPGSSWHRRWRRSIWSLENRVLLQIGLGSRGTEIAKRAKELRMQVWGTRPGQTHPTFHPYCHKVFTMNDLHTILPSVDVVSICIPRQQEPILILGRKELELMKDDSVILALDHYSVVDEDALADVAKTGKFRGILFDALYGPAVPLTSPLWKIPNLLITPEISSRPISTGKHAFRVFHYNMRQYQYDNFSGLRNRIELG